MEISMKKKQPWCLRVVSLLEIRILATLMCANITHCAKLKVASCIAKPTLFRFCALVLEKYHCVTSPRSRQSTQGVQNRNVDEAWPKHWRFEYSHSPNRIQPTILAPFFLPPNMLTVGIWLCRQLYLPITIGLANRRVLRLPPS